MMPPNCYRTNCGDIYGRFRSIDATHNLPYSTVSSIQTAKSNWGLACNTGLNTIAACRSTATPGTPELTVIVTTEAVDG